MSGNLKITVRFIHTKISDPSTDDMVYITRYAPNQYRLSYTYGIEKDNKTTHSLVLSDKAVFRWMRATLCILEKDADPFNMVQLDTPFMPSVVFNVSNLGAAYHPLLDALEFHLDNWPTPPVLNPEDELEEEDYEEEEQEEEDNAYAGMPPLVPLASRGRQHLFLDEDD